MPVKIRRSQRHAPSSPGRKAKHEYAQVLIAAQALGLPSPLPEYRFAPPRRWRFDYAWPALLLAVEIEGGVWVRGRHVRGAGYLADLEKYNAAVLLGWRVLRYTPQTLGNLSNDLKALLESRRQ